MKAPVNTALAVGLMAVIMIISLEAKHDTALAETHKDGFAAGYALGQSDIAETMAKKVTTEKCMAFWFSDDSKRVGAAIQKIKLETTK